MIESGTLVGEKVRLRPVEERDLPLFVRWYTDPDVRRWLHLSDRPEVTLESERQNLEKGRVNPSNLGLVIETGEGQPIGTLGLINIDPYHRRAELGISIGEKEYWGRGYGSDAIRVALRHAFTEMGLRRAYLITDEDNERGIRCYQKCGFVQEGLLRAHRLRYGQPIDMLIMGVLREEWDASGKRKASSDG